MFSFTGFNEKANEALNNAVAAAEDLGHTYIGSEHLLAGLLKDTGSVSGVILNNKKLTFQKYIDMIKDSVGSGIPTELSEGDITPRAEKILRNSLGIAAGRHCALAGTEHILCALLREPRCFACRLLIKAGFSPVEIYSDIIVNSSAASSAQRKTENGSSRLPTLSKYGRDLTAAAFAGKIDPVSCREAETERIIKILSRKTKNNPCLTGEPGVGKTAVAEGLALRIASGNVPDCLKNTRIFSLELTGMVAGAKYRGDFEERIKNAVDEVISAGNIILFIDEIHNLIGAGSAEGAVDAANILKPVLARGELRVIGATTAEEYRKTIEKDGALERRFQTVNIEEPTKEQTLIILENLRPGYEAFHGVCIGKDALEAAVSLSSRYITDRFLPDKAIDLIDETAAGAGIEKSDYPPHIKELEKMAAALCRKKTDAVNRQEFEKAAALRDEEKILVRKLNEAIEKWNEDEKRNARKITAGDIAKTLSEWTKIPVGKLCQDEKSRLLNIEKMLSSKIIGQDEAVKAVAAAVRRGRAGIESPCRPAGTFLFCGPTGVGKTELAKQLAAACFGDENALIRLDMSGYSESHSIARLIGAPPGYAGYDDGGRLIGEIRKKPYSVILFDEIEKAHPDIFSFLLPVLEDGILTAADGRKASCRSSVIILTSNAGAREMEKSGYSPGFYESSDDSDNRKIKDAALRELKRIFPPEFLNRIDETVFFRKLNREDIEKIASGMIENLKKRLAAAGTEAYFSPDVIKFIADKGYDRSYGARYLERTIINELENPVSELLISHGGNVKKFECVRSGMTLKFHIAE